MAVAGEGVVSHGGHDCGGGHGEDENVGYEVKRSSTWFVVVVFWVV